MNLSFLGNSLFLQPDVVENKILEYLSTNVKDNNAEALLSGNSNFDLFVKDVCEKYQTSHPNFSLKEVSENSKINDADLVISCIKYDTEEAIEKLNAVKNLNKKLVALQF